MKLWLDDMRPAPMGWTLAATMAQAQEYLRTAPVEEASLDHDLGACVACTKARGGNWGGNMPHCEHVGTGYTLCVWMAQTGHWPQTKPTVHSMNAEGAARMRGVITRYFGTTGEAERPQLTKATTFIPDASMTLSKRPAAFPSGMPQFAVHGRGPHVAADDGREYLDWMCGLGALTVGHTHPRVVRAVQHQMALGAIFSLPSVLESQVAERLCGIIPCAEQIRVVKTGSEACAAAARIARMATGRDVLVVDDVGYHGWHDGFGVVKDKHPGVPDSNLDTTWAFERRNLNSLRELFDDSRGEIAAVMIEPVMGETPDPAYLQAVVDIAHDDGALVIFDEMLCGGRLALGGAQAYCNVTPDLGVFGKAFGGGLPFAFVAGPRHVMKHAWPISGTFSGDALALAAADAMLDIYRDEGVIEALWSHGRMAMSAIQGVIDDRKLPIRIEGQAPRFWLTWDGVDKRLPMSVFVQRCAEAGVLVHPNVFFANAAMTLQEVEASCFAFIAALHEVADGLRDNDLAHRLVGDMYADSVR